MEWWHSYFYKFLMRKHEYEHDQTVGRIQRLMLIVNWMEVDIKVHLLSYAWATDEIFIIFMFEYSPQMSWNKYNHIYIIVFKYTMTRYIFTLEGIQDRAMHFYSMLNILYILRENVGNFIFFTVFLDKLKLFFLKFENVLYVMK